MNMPKITKKDKRTEAEKTIDDFIDQQANEATQEKSVEKASKVLKLMRERREVEKVKVETEQAEKLDPMVVCNIIGAGASVINMLLVFKGEKIDGLIPSKTLLNLVPKVRLR